MSNREMFHQMLNSRSNPQRAYAILSSMAATVSDSDKGNVATLTERINACKHPRRVYAAALTLAPIIREAKTQQEREALLADLKGDTEA